MPRAAAIITLIMTALLLLSIVEDVDGLNLSSVRRALQTTGSGGGSRRQTRNVSYFKKDLPFPIMPLCGNGRLDKRDDYEKYFANLGFGDVFQVPRRVISGQSEEGEVVGLKIVVDEACDDGNRRDGDGCSADCLVRDKIDSSCEIAVRWPNNNNNATVSYEEIGISQSVPYVVVGDGIYRLDVGLTAMTPTLLARKSFSAHAMTIVNDATMYIYSATDLSIFSLPISKNNDNNMNKVLTKICTLRGTPSTEPGQFYLYKSPQQQTGQLFLVRKDASSASLIRVVADGCVEESIMFSTLELKPLLLYAWQGNCVFIRMRGALGYRESSISLCPGLSPVYYAGTDIDPRTYNKPWIQSTMLAFGYNLETRFVSDGYMKLMVVNRSSHDISQSFPESLIKETTALNQLFMYSSFFMVHMLPSFRYKFYDYYLGGGDINFIGDPVIYSGVSSSEDYVCGVQPCVLDFYTQYNILYKNPNARISATDVTFSSVLDSLFSRSIATSWSDFKNVNDTIALYESELLKYGFVIGAKNKRIVNDPLTGSDWIIDGPLLVEVSRRGASFEVGGGKCVPASVGVCPPCYMYQNVGPCVACPPPLASASASANTSTTTTKVNGSATDNSSSKNASLEWKLQCGACFATAAATVAPQRRLLLAAVNDEQPFLLTVGFVVRGATTDEIKALFPGANMVVGSMGSLDVKIATANPGAVISTVQTTAIESGGRWKMDVQPRIIYTMDPSLLNNGGGGDVSSSGSSSDNALPILVGGTLGGTAFICILICVLYCVYHKRPVIIHHNLHHQSNYPHKPMYSVVEDGRG